MLIRLALLLCALLIITLLATYMVTRELRYLHSAIRVARFIGYVLLVSGGLYLLERYGLVAWRVFV